VVAFIAGEYLCVSVCVCAAFVSFNQRHLVDKRSRQKTRELSSYLRLVLQQHSH